MSITSFRRAIAPVMFVACLGLCASPVSAAQYGSPTKAHAAKSKAKKRHKKKKAVRTQPTVPTQSTLPPDRRDPVNEGY